MPTLFLFCICAGFFALACSESGAAVNLARGPYLQSCTTTGIVVRWRTDAPAESRVVFGTDEFLDDGELNDGVLVTEHIVRLTNLAPDTTYWYSVGSSSDTLASGSEYYFRTGPTNSRPIRVWALGDSGSGTINQTAVRDAYLNASNNIPTDVWLMLGDNIYEQGLDEEYQRLLFEPYQDILRHTVLWPALGNHDTPPGGWPFPYLNAFTAPTHGEAGGVPSNSGLYYSFNYGNVHFVCLDSWVSSRSMAGPMIAWLRADLAAAQQDWIIAYWHHPPYSMGTDFSDSTVAMLEMRERVVPILEEFGVDLVLCGHSHVYERSYLIHGHYGSSWTFDPSYLVDSGRGRSDEGRSYRKRLGDPNGSRGTVYMVCGNSGQGGPVHFQTHPVMATKSDGYGSVVLDVDGLRLNARYLQSNGRVVDYFTIDKSLNPGPIAALNVIRTTSSVSLSWPAALTAMSLETADSMDSTNWQPVIRPPATVGQNVLMKLSPTNSGSFFRLRSTL